MHAHEPGDPPRERLRLPRPGASNDAQRRVARRAHRDALILVQATEHLRVTCVICPCRHLILARTGFPGQRNGSCAGTGALLLKTQKFD